MLLPEGVYLPISKLHSILAITNSFACNDISQICYYGQISLQSAAAYSSSTDNLTPFGYHLFCWRCYTSITEIFRKWCSPWLAAFHTMFLTSSDWLSCAGDVLCSSAFPRQWVVCTPLETLPLKGPPSEEVVRLESWGSSHPGVNTVIVGGRANSQWWGTQHIVEKS